MELNLDPNSKFEVMDSFEINVEHDHPSGVVVVLDRQVLKKPAKLIGLVVKIQLTSRHFSLQVFSAKDHLTATSLFFEGKTIDDIPSGATLTFLSPLL